MQFISIISNPSISGLDKLIGFLINSFGSVVLGIVIFTLLLKVLTFPFDYLSRASMRRTSLKMKEMRPELERLQEQYKNNKQLYQQKVMALQKKEGMNMFKSCLPTILTLVIFIVVLSSFNAYSTYQNQKDIYNMAVSYNSVIIDAFDVDGEYVKKESNGKQTVINIDVLKAIANDTDSNANTGLITGLTNQNGESFELKYTIETVDGSSYSNYKFTTTNSYVSYTYAVDLANSSVTAGSFSAEYDNFSTEMKADFDVYKILKTTATANDYLTELQRNSANKTYLDERQGFLWIKNVWKPDRVDESAIITDKTVIEKVISYANYEEISKNVQDESNGWYIIIAINILVTFLSQWVMKKTQKDQLELQSADGQAMGTQKMMMWMMPIMMAVFSFIYTAAFSVYIILSTSFSILSSLLINKIVDVSYNKEQDKKSENIVRRG